MYVQYVEPKSLVTLLALSTDWRSFTDVHSIFQAQSQYVLTTQQLQGGTVRQMTRASQKGAPPGGRAHITLNPYSTQLVDNLNMMMPTTEQRHVNSAGHSMTMQPKLLNLTNTLKGGVQQQQLHQQHQLQHQEDEYVYRAVSPNGHIYYEIDPNYAVLNQYQQQHVHQQQQQQPLLLEEHLLQQQQHQQHLLQLQHAGSAESSGDTSSSRESSARFNSSSSNEQRPLISSPVRASEMPAAAATSSFVRTGASRFGSRFRPQTVTSEIPGSDVTDSGKPLEQLQTQVQIKDCKALKVQVKSSEYIENKIRTLRKSNNVALNN